ncbi:NAD(P)-dependent oxidoreductase [Rhodopseudomonas sp. RCAM05734]|uniref:NAD(P)-dependent oxidoreductase n=1 Tax=Rhodopseudomonas sp. RCAM05734 TaxID=3457549 RepID=UPI0040451289
MPNPMPLQKVGFIGLGIMGNSMAGHLLAGGHELHVFNRTRAKVDNLLARGAVWHDAPGEIAAVCDVVITMVGYPADVEAIYLGADGLITRARRDSILIDMTTSSPLLAQRIAETGLGHGCHVLDAPVSGGDVGARNAKLAIMVGGDAEALQRVMPLLALMGNNIVHQGAAGAGQHTKMANQIAIASTMIVRRQAL